MKRLGIWIFYCIGALAIGYLALYAYAVFSGRDLQPGDPIRIFRNPDAPSYSSRVPDAVRHSSCRSAEPGPRLSEQAGPRLCSAPLREVLRAALRPGHASLTPSRPSADSRRHPQA